MFTTSLPDGTRRRAVHLIASGLCLAPWMARAQREPLPGALGRSGRAVGLLLPHGSAFEAVGRALYAGVAQAHTRLDEPMQIWPQTVADEPAALTQTLADWAKQGVELVLGPLTRKGVQALLELGPLRLPTLALSLPEQERPAVPSPLSFLGLAIEIEVQQAATHAMSDVILRATEHRPRAAVVGVNNALMRRAATAFEQAWRSVGGEWRGVVDWGQGTPADVAAQINQQPPEVLLSLLDAAQLRRLRPLLHRKIMTWASALTLTRSVPQPEWDGVYVMEMPCVVEPDNPAVVMYDRAPPGLSVELQRIYALGIDAVRVGQQLLNRAQAFEMDGLTGWLRYDALSSARVERVCVPAVFRGGVPVALSAL